MPATFLYINDSGGNTWQIGVDDNGILSAISVAAQSPVAIDLNAGGMSWRLGIGTDGCLSSASEAFNAANPTYVAIASPSGYFYQVRVDNNGILSTTQVFAQSISAAGQIASAVALGVASVLLSISLAGSGIDGAEAFGTAKLNQRITGAGGIANGERFGIPTLSRGISGQMISGVGGIPSGESWGMAQLWPALVISPRRAFKTVGREKSSSKQKETKIFKTGPRPRGGA